MKTAAHSSARPGLPALPCSKSWSILADWWARRRTEATIRHLDNRLRRDIGLDPIPISAAVSQAERMVAMNAWR